MDQVAQPLVGQDVQQPAQTLAAVDVLERLRRPRGREPLADILAQPARGEERRTRGQRERGGPRSDGARRGARPPCRGRGARKPPALGRRSVRDGRALRHVHGRGHPGTDRATRLRLRRRAAGSLFDLAADPRLNHRIRVTAGVAGGQVSYAAPGLLPHAPRQRDVARPRRAIRPLTLAVPPDRCATHGRPGDAHEPG